MPDSCTYLCAFVRNCVLFTLRRICCLRRRWRQLCANSMACVVSNSKLGRKVAGTTPIAAAILVVDPKDEQAAKFYYRYGFLDIGPGRTRLYMPVSEIEKVLPSARREAREQHVEGKGT